MRKIKTISEKLMSKKFLKRDKQSWTLDWFSFFSCRILKVSEKKFKHVRFLGAEGIGMSGLIKILSQFKNAPKISKSDIAYKNNDPLDNDIDLVVRSTAINDQDTEFQELKNRNIDIWHRRDMLNFLSATYKQIVVSGTHGKTTCSAMLSFLFKELNLDPAFAVGGILANYDSNACYGQGEYFILEGDESDKSFTHSKPHCALVTCIEEDHLENYPGGLQEIQECFYGFLKSAAIKIINIDDDFLYTYYLENKDNEKIITYSCKNKNADFYIDVSSKSFYYKKQKYQLNLNFPGSHNFINAVAVLACSVGLEQDLETAMKKMQNFAGIKRRFELINSNYRGAITVFDDYAHHPTEINALIKSFADFKDKKIVFVYQPHHPERTKQLWHDFVSSFQNFPQEHLCLLLDIYIARSKPIEGINSERLVEEINKENVIYIKAKEQEKNFQGNFLNIVDALKENIEANIPKDTDVLFLVGAGNIGKIAESFKPLKHKMENEQ